MKRFLIIPLIVCICSFGLVSCKTPELSPETPPAPTVPAKPLSASATPDPNPYAGKITVDWEASDDDGGSPLLGFKVGICEGEHGESECVHVAYDEFEWFEVSTSRKKDYTVISKLDERKTYTIRVRSYNAIGESSCFWINNAASCSCQG